MKFYGETPFHRIWYHNAYGNNNMSRKKPNVYGNVTIRRFMNRVLRKSARLHWKRNIWEGWLNAYLEESKVG